MFTQPYTAPVRELPQPLYRLYTTVKKEGQLTPSFAAPSTTRALESAPGLDREGARTYDLNYLTKEQAAKIVGLHPKTIEREIQRGNLRAFKPAGKIRIHPDDLTVWIESTALSPSVHAI